MREIKFRGKDMKSQKWVCGDLLHFDDETSIRSYDVYSPLAFLSTVDPTTVGQYTGLKDKNGVEIYECDVLSDARDRLYVIVWRAGGPCVYNADEYRDLCLKAPVTLHDALADRQICEYVRESLTVVGNIHDSPEMLTPKDN